MIPSLVHNEIAGSDGCAPSTAAVRSNTAKHSAFGSGLPFDRLSIKLINKLQKGSLEPILLHKHFQAWLHLRGTSTVQSVEFFDITSNSSTCDSEIEELVWMDFPCPAGGDEAAGSCMQFEIVEDVKVVETLPTIYEVIDDDKCDDNPDKLSYICCMVCGTSVNAFVIQKCSACASCESLHVNLREIITEIYNGNASQDDCVLEINIQSWFPVDTLDTLPCPSPLHSGHNGYTKHLFVTIPKDTLLVDMCLGFELQSQIQLFTGSMEPLVYIDQEILDKWDFAYDVQNAFDVFIEAECSSWSPPS